MIPFLILAAVVVAAAAGASWWRTCRVDAAAERAFEVRLELALANLRERDAAVRPRSIPSPDAARRVPRARHGRHR